MDVETVKLGVSFVLTTAALYRPSLELVDWVSHRFTTATSYSKQRGASF